MISHSTPGALPPHEHLRQLHRVYGPLSPAFVAEELHCTLDEAIHHLYGPHAALYTWVSLADLAYLTTVDMAVLKRWVRRHHLQSAHLQRQARSAPAYIHLDDAHLDDARHFLQDWSPGGPLRAEPWSGHLLSPDAPGRA